MIVVRKLMSAVVLTTCVFFAIGLFTVDGGSTASEPSSFADRVIGWMIATWYVGVCFYGFTLRIGNPHRGWAFGLLILWAIFVFTIMQQPAPGKVSVPGYFYRTIFLMFFAVPIIQFLDMLLPPYGSRMSGRRQSQAFARSGR